MLSLIFSLLIATTTFATAGGDWVGNGGNILVCPSPTTPELFDYYEGRLKRGARISLGEANTYEEKVHFVLARLEKINPSRAKLYKKWYADFFSETEWLVHGKLTPIPDLGVGVIPESCGLVQAAAQKPDSEILPGDKRYIIDQKVWNSLSEETKAGLILHELIYREAIYSNQVSSQKVRYLNQLVSSENFNDVSNIEWITVLKQMGFLVADYGQFNISLETATFYPSGLLKSATAVGGEIPMFESQIELNAKILQFFENGQLQSISLSHRDLFQYKFEGDVLNLGGTGPAKIVFYNDGQLLSSPLQAPQPIRINGQTVLASNTQDESFGPCIKFWNNGNIKAVKLSSPYTWSNSKFRLKIIGSVEFDEHRNLVSDCVYASPGSLALSKNQWQPIEGLICLTP